MQSSISDAQIRFLKAKARVMQEEMERLSEELAIEREGNNKLTSRIKELEDERNKLSRCVLFTFIQLLDAFIEDFS